MDIIHQKNQGSHNNYPLFYVETTSMALSSEPSLFIEYSLFDSTLCSSLAHASPTPPYFRPLSCPDPNKIGIHCNISSHPCELLKPCRNNATCIDSNATAVGYTCICPPSFDGDQCQIDNRPCKPETCWNNGNPSLSFKIMYLSGVFVL